MKYLFSLLLIFLAAALFWTSFHGRDSGNEITFAQVDPLQKVFRESSYFPHYGEPVDAAAGEQATFQFVVRSGKELSDLKAHVSPFKNSKGDTLGQNRTGFVEFVRVGRQTPERARDAFISLSGYYPDPIMEKETWSAGRDMAQPIWVTAFIPRDAVPGDYTAAFKLTGKSGGVSFQEEKEIRIKVYPVVMDTPALWVSNWFSTDSAKMKIFNGGKDVIPYSEEYWNMVRELAGKLKECYSNVILISPLEHVGFKETDGVYTFDFTHFDKMVSIFEEKDILKRLEGGHIAGRTGGWGSGFAAFVPEIKDGKKTLVQYPMSEAKAQNFYKQFLPALMKHLKEKKLEGRYVQHIADEPIDSNIKSYVEIADFVKKLCPDLKILEACHTHNLQNTINIWIPQLNFYEEGYSFYLDRQKQGDEVWFYTCMSPQGEFANRFLDQPVIKTRLIHWLNFRYGATGYLHWGFNQWLDGKDPFKEATHVYTEGGNVLPGGDSWIVYPDRGKLHGSLRLEAMRDGIADYALLKMLERKDPNSARELCRQIVYNWTKYDTESGHFRETRRRILEELSAK